MAGSSSELPWDLLDRCLLPFLFSHAAAVLVSTLLNLLRISQVSAFTLFLLFIVVALGSTLFYHNLKVTVAGKCILISGCESKLGYATAKHLDELGFTVFAGFERAGDSSSRLKEEASGRMHCIEMDPTSEQSVLQAFNYVATHLPEETPGLWAVINCACWAAFGEVEWVPRSVYQRSLDINFMGAVRVTQVFLPMLRKTKGRLVVISSLLGRLSTGLRSPFCASKAALDSFATCLRLEMAKWGVDVVLVEPGSATTGTWFENKEMVRQAKDMWTAMDDQAHEAYGEDYFEFKVRSMKEYNRGPEDVTVAVKCIGDAVTRTFPLARYTPVTREEKLESLISHHLPASIHETIYNR